MATTEHPEGALHTKSIVDELATQRGPLQLVVVSPQRKVFEGAATHVRAESIRGSMGIWPGHADIVAALGVGPLVIGTTKGEERFAVWGGFLKVGSGKITVLVDRAAAVDEIDAEAVRAELKATIEELAHPSSEERFEELLQTRRWCETRLRLA
ncbi:MAG: ATP synthase F1 subunit epsilon [Planctomycetota bacterium]|jgi:F-type H+-transporting ATPase subunit epsilon